MTQEELCFLGGEQGHKKRFKLIPFFHKNLDFRVCPYTMTSLLLGVTTGATNLPPERVSCVCVSDLGVSVAVLRREDETGEVAGQVQPSEVPDQVPVDDGMMVHHVGLCDHRVALVLEQTLQLLPQHQRAQIGNRHRLWVVEPPLHIQRVLGGTKMTEVRLLIAMLSEGEGYVVGAERSAGKLSTQAA